MRKKVGIIAFIIVLVSHTVLSSSVSLTAIAKELGASIFTDVTLTGEEGTLIDGEKNPEHHPDKDAQVNLNFEWSLVGMEVNADDTYSYKLPSQIIPKTQSGKLLSSGNTEIGTYRVTADGLLTIAFNEEADVNSVGKLTIEANFNKEVIADSEEVLIPFTLNNQEKVIHVAFQADTTVEVESNKDAKIDGEDDAEETLDNEVNSASHIQVANDNEKREPILITENIIKDGTLVLEKSDGTPVEENEILQPGEKFQLKFDWELPEDHEYILGDTFELQLPAQLKIYNEITGELSEFGTYKVTEDGKVTFIFNESIENHSFVHGYLHVETELNEEKLTTTEDVLEFKVNDEVVEKIAVNYKPKGGQAIAKSGKPANGNSFNAEEIEWTVIVNTTRDSLKNAIIDDQIPAGLELIEGSIELREVEVNIQGQIIKDKDVVNIGDGNKSTPEKLLLELGDTNKAYKLTFKTKVKEEEKDKEGVTVYHNTVKLKSDGKDEATHGASVSITRPESLVKTSSAFNEEDRSVEWEVKANFNEKNLKQGDTITDEFTFTVGDKQYNDKFEVIDIEILQVDEFDENGNPTKTSDASNLVGYNIEGNKVTYTMKDDTNKAFIFKYKTKVKQGEYITHDGKITNEVTLDGKTKANSSQGIYQQVGRKTHGKIDYEKKTIDWIITINADEQDLKNFVLTDDFSGSGQKLVDDSIIVNPGVSPDKIKVNDNKDGFEIDFGDITDTYTITYQTKFDYDFGSKEQKPNFVNRLKLSYKIENDEKEYNLEIVDKVDPNAQTKSNGAKKGEVNNQTKEITWSVDINYNNLKLDNARFEDKISENQSSVADSVKIYETTIDKDGNVMPGHNVTDQFTKSTDNDAIKIDFGEIDRSYRVEFVTVDKDGIYNHGEKYENTAQFIPRENEVHNLKAHVQLPHQGEFLGKKGVHNKDDWTIDWQIVVNKSKSKLTDITVADNLGDEKLQLLLEDTIKVAKDGSDETLVAGEDYKLKVNGNGFELKFINDFKETNETFIVSYSSYILAQKTVALTNKANVTSEEKVDGTTSKEDSIHVGISTGGGGAQGVTGDLILKKFEDGKLKPLKDVNFVLKTTVNTKEIIVREGMTNADGLLHWSGLKYGKYTLEETVPAGYLSADPLEIELKRDEMPEGIKTIEIENKRLKGTAKIVKKDAVTNETLANATFKITNLDTNQEFTLTTNGEGVAEADVPFGDYKVEEIQAPKGYKIATELNNIKVETGTTTEITIDNDALIDISGEKTWIDGDSKNRPNAITVQLFDGGDEPIKDKIISATENWKYTFEKLPKYNDEGKKIKYAVKEVPVDGYKSKVDGYNIVNIELMDISGEKTWKDDNTKERPEKIKVNLIRNGEMIDTKEVTVTDNWKYNFTDLEKYDKEGKEYTYTVEEVPVEGYESTVDGYDITNLRVGKISVEGTKTWLDDDSENRPDKITVKLLQNGEEILTAEMTAENDWTYIFTDLEKYDKEGKEYRYTVEEVPVKGYETSIEGYNITNLRVGKTSVEGTKTWKDDNSENRPESITVKLLQNGEEIDSQEVTAEDNWKYSFTDLDEFDENGVAYKYTVEEKAVAGYETTINGNDITNLRVGKTEVYGTKTWKDDNSEDRPDSIKVNLLQNGTVIDTVEVTPENNWTYSFTDLEKYDLEGVAYEYTIKEHDVPGYASEVDGYDITNTRSEKKTIEVTKGWLDDNSSERPESITVHLLQNGEVIETVELTRDADWKYEFTELEAYDQNGVAYQYTVEEEEVEGYKTTIDGYDITNLRVGKTKVTGTKTWKDDNSPERPESITVKLLRNGEEIASQEVTAEDNWKYSFTDLDKFDEKGVAYKYTIEEVAVKGYETTIDGYNMTNLRVGKIEVSGTKTWKDDNSENRPESISVKLIQNGNEIDSQEITAEDNWKYSFTDLDEFDEKGVAYEYTIVEEAVKGYETTIEGYDITNLRVGKTSVEGTKTWKDDNSENRPESITVKLLQNGEEIDSKEVTAQDNWKYRFTDLEEFDDNGAAYKYTVQEEPLKGYQTTVKGYDITNVRVGKTSVEGTKTWKDDNSKDRPDMIKVNLLQNGVVVDTQEVKADSDWKYSFTDLAKYDEEGKAYKYSVKEHGVPGYKSEIDGYDITNTRSEKTSVIVTKGWKDDNSKERPDSITVNLLQNGKVIDTVEVKAAEDWTYMFNDLEAYDKDGKAYEYTVEEEEIDGYESTVDGYDITNLRVGKTSVEGTKTWNDDSFNGRPEMIKVDLLQNGDVIDTADVTADTDWKYSFADLEKYDEEGKVYTYSVQEHAVEGYESIVSGFDITNKLIFGEVELIKVDKDNHRITLSGAEFELQDAEGKTIKESLTTDKSGKLSVSGLKPGNYQMIETKAPEGYEKLKERITFTIEKGQKEALTLIVENTAISPVTPTDPEQPGDGMPIDSGKPVETGTNPVQSGDEGKSGYKLPNTATSLFNFALAGIILLFAGVVLARTSRKRQQ